MICVANALNGEAIDLTDRTIVAELATTAMWWLFPMPDSANRIDDLFWTAAQLGKGNGDQMLDPGETFEMTIDLTAAGIL